MASRPWPFGVTWCHRSRDHSISHRSFPIWFFRHFFGQTHRLAGHNTLQATERQLTYGLYCSIRATVRSAKLKTWFLVLPTPVPHRNPPPIWQSYPSNFRTTLGFLSRGSEQRDLIKLWNYFVIICPLWSQSPMLQTDRQTGDIFISIPRYFGWDVDSPPAN